MATKIESLDVQVRYSVSAYVTNTVRGQRVSCTHSAEEAARRLGQKLFGTGFKRVEQLRSPSDSHVVTAWRLHGIEENHLVL